MTPIIPFKQPVDEIIEQMGKLVHNLHNVSLDEIFNTKVIADDDEEVEAILALNHLALTIAQISLATLQHQQRKGVKCKFL